jgi:hypothetical protein
MQPGISRKRRRGLVLDDTVGLKKRYVLVEIIVAVQVSPGKTPVIYNNNPSFLSKLR